MSLQPSDGYVLSLSYKHRKRPRCSSYSHRDSLYSLGAHYGDVYCNESKDVKTQELELLTSSFQKNSRPRCAISFYNKPILGAMGSRGHRSIYRCRWVLSWGSLFWGRGSSNPIQDDGRWVTPVNDWFSSLFPKSLIAHPSPSR